MIGQTLHCWNDINAHDRPARSGDAVNLGIDFGTTNSSLAFQRSARQAPECVSVDNHTSLPFDVILRTAVALDRHGRVIEDEVGAAALDPVSRRAPKHQGKRRVIQHIKPFLSTFRLREEWPVQRTCIDQDQYDHLRQEPMSVSYSDVVVSGDIECSREELMMAAAAVFRRLFRSTPDSVMRERPQIVVGVPLIFPDYAKKRLLDIIVRSGECGTAEPYREAVRRVRFLPEPIAASLLYALECEPPRGRKRGRVLIFDSGGGTLDLALLEFETVAGEYRPVRQLALNAAVLAGRKFDEVIVNQCLSAHRNAVKHWTHDAANPDEATNWYMAQAAESIKLALSTRQEHTELSLGGAGVRPTVTRGQFESWSAPLLNDTEALVRKTVDDLDAVDTVIMVGGSSLIPSVQGLIRRLFPCAQVVHEDASQMGRGEGVERALTAVSKGLAMYDNEVARQGITPFAYGFRDPVTHKDVYAAAKWTKHDGERPTVSVSAAPGTAAMTLSLLQELVEPQLVLNVLNVPVLDSVHSTNLVRVRTTDGSLYPDILLIDPATGDVAAEMRVEDLAEHILQRLIEGDNHVVRWPASSVSAAEDTAFPEVVIISAGDHVSFIVDPSTSTFQHGVVREIHRISDGRKYNEAGHWDLRRWRFYITQPGHRERPFVPARVTDIQLDRRSNLQRRNAASREQ